MTAIWQAEFPDLPYNPKVRFDLELAKVGGFS
jgi:hypothetical protein